MKVLVTGASGFLGSAIASYLFSRGHDVVGVVRDKKIDIQAEEAPTTIPVGPLEKVVSWESLLGGVDCVVHCAGHAQSPRSFSPEADRAYLHKVNVELVRNIARNAVTYGVRRLIFLSSIKVLGEKTSDGIKFDEQSPYDPSGLYAETKCKGEIALIEAAADSSLQYVILRLPIVYGAGSKGNLRSMVRLIRSGVPLPFGAIANKRSFLGLRNLVSAVDRCIEHPQVGNRIFLLSDRRALSTAELVCFIAKSVGVSERLLSVNPEILRLVGKSLGLESYVRRLVDSLEVDSSKFRNLTGWVQPFSSESEIEMMTRS